MSADDVYGILDDSYIDDDNPLEFDEFPEDCCPSCGTPYKHWQTNEDGYLYCPNCKLTMDEDDDDYEPEDEYFQDDES